MASSSNNAAQEHIDSFPPGFHFRPTDIELITYYLNPKNNGGYLPPNMIHEVSLYEGEGPELLTNDKYFFLGDDKVKEWYFFTRRERKYVNGGRPKRSAGSGYWKATGQNVSIYNEDEEIIGKKRSLKFFTGKPPNGVKTNWLMHEYQPLDDDENNNKKSKKSNPSTCDTSIIVASQSNSKNPMLDGYVLCKVYNKDLKIDDQTPDAEKVQQLRLMHYEEQQAAPIMQGEEQQLRVMQYEEQQAAPIIMQGEEQQLRVMQYEEQQAAPIMQGEEQQLRLMQYEEQQAAPLMQGEEQQLRLMQYEEQQVPLMLDEVHQRTEHVQYHAESHTQGPIAQTEDQVLPIISHYPYEQYQQHVPTHALNHEPNFYTPTIASNNIQFNQFAQQNPTYVPKQEYVLDYDLVNRWLDEAAMQQPLLLPPIEPYGSNDTLMNWMAGMYLHGTHPSSSPSASSNQTADPTRRWPGPSAIYSANSICDELSAIFKK